MPQLAPHSSTHSAKQERRANRGDTSIMPSVISGTGDGSVFDDAVSFRKAGLARKLTCLAVSVVSSGICLILLIQVVLIVTSVPDWGADTKQAMIELEKENILKLASDKAEYVTENFGRVKEGLLQVQAFAGQALLEVPETMIVDQYLKSYSGLDQSGDTWEHSVWFISEYGDGELPVVGSTQEGLLNRSSLMDVPFRGMQRQHLLVFLAALDDPSQTSDDISDVNMQSYAGFNMKEAGYLDFGDREVCDTRFNEDGDSNEMETYDPRCRSWYQDAVATANAEVIFTNPYTDAGSEQLIVTVAAQVLDSVDSSLLLGVVGIDMDFTDVESSINDLRVIGNEGYAYLLAPGGEGEVAVHYDLETFGDTQYIVDLEAGVDEVSFNDMVSRMSEECTGLETYEREGDGTWLISWKHESVSGSSTVNEGDECSVGGFIVVVTVSESLLLKEFSETERQIANVVAVASVIMALALVAFGCIMGCFAYSISKGITQPVNQLIHVVHALNKMDFSRQAPGMWIVNDVTSPEMVELINAFEAMTAVVKFANMTLGKGDLDVARQNYIDALVLFTKLGNDRGVSIANNNLGAVHTLQAEALAARAAESRNRGNTVEAKHDSEQADLKFSDAVTNYHRAIEDAEMLCAATTHQDEGVSPSPIKPHPHPHPATAHRKGPEFGDETKADEGPSSPADDVEIGATDDCDGLDASAALSLQLANRKFNLALCLAAKMKNNANNPGKDKALFQAEADEARRLMNECVVLARERQHALGDQRQVECLLALAALEHDQGAHRQRQAGEALDAVQRAIISYRGATSDDHDANTGLGLVVPSSTGGIGVGGESPQPAPLAVLQQQLLAARGAHSLAGGDTVAAIDHWAQAVIGCGDRMDTGAVGTSLLGLRDQAANGAGRHFPSDLLVALGLPPGSGKNSVSLTASVDDALTLLQRSAASAGVKILESSASKPTNVDLCFVMDCTGSMQRWINQAKDKLTDIIKQAKKDVANLNLRVAFVGYRDFGDKVQYEGPFDFHTENELPRLLDKLKGIKAYGGQDFPEDIAGGLKKATELSWRSPIRLCILIADAPCHGLRYHGSIGDNYPKGCPNGLSPTKLLWSLQYELGVDFYFVRITHVTDKMIKVFKSEIAAQVANSTKTRRPVLRGTTNTKPKFVEHKLGSNDNQFLDAVVQSVRVSAGINLHIETY